MKHPGYRRVIRNGMTAVVLGILAAGLFIVGRRAFLWGAITEAKWTLIQNIEAFRNGETNFPTGPEGQRVFLFTNVVALSGTNYTCALGVDRAEFQGRGILVTTTNRTFIWIRKGGKAELK